MKQERMTVCQRACLDQANPNPFAAPCSRGTRASLQTHPPPRILCPMRSYHYPGQVKRMVNSGLPSPFRPRFLVHWRQAHPNPHHRRSRTNSRRRTMAPGRFSSRLQASSYHAPGGGEAYRSLREALVKKILAQGYDEASMLEHVRKPGLLFPRFA
jgi:hypothetical protein